MKRAARVGPGLGDADRRTAFLGALAACALAAGCRSQRFPGPMENLVDPLPAGAVSEWAPGPAEAIVMRHGDPVQVRRAGSRSGFPLTHYKKRERVLSGAWMLVGPGGRGEIFWPDSGTNAVFFDQGACRVGEPSRGEPDLFVIDLSMLRLSLAAGARVALPGAAELRGDPQAGGGPYDLRMVDDRILRVRNQSTSLAWLDYRRDTIQLGPGDVIDLPVLVTGRGPERAEGEGWVPYDRIVAHGEVERLEGRGVQLRANSAAELVGQGVRVHAEPGELVTFDRLGNPARGFTRPGPRTREPEVTEVPPEPVFVPSAPVPLAAPDLGADEPPAPEGAEAAGESPPMEGSQTTSDPASPTPEDPAPGTADAGDPAPAVTEPPDPDSAPPVQVPDSPESARAPR